MKYWYAIALLVLAGCGKDLLDTDPINRGVLPLTPYVAIGGSETAGFADGALHFEAQQYSYPALIAQQLQLVGGNSFTQPLTADTGGFAFINGILLAKFDLGNKEDCLGETSVIPVRREVTNGTFASSFYASKGGPYGNMGIPFLKVADIDNVNLSASNRYYFRTGLDSISVAEAVLAQSPRLFTIWLGMEDLLAQAISQVPAPAAIQYYNYLLPLVDSLAQDTAAAGFVATLPDVTAFPFFNTIPYNALELDQPLADALNQAYVGQGISFQPGPNAFIIADANAPGGKRQIKATEKLLLTLPLDSVKCLFLGSLTPISAQYVLDEAELAEIRSQVLGYNVIIRELAEEKGLSVVDINALYAKLETGLQINGQEFNNELVSGGFFSLDGLNPSQRGAALIANEFIAVMNAEYRATIPTVSVVQLPGIRFP